MRDRRGTGKSCDGSLRGRRLPGSGQAAIAEVQELQGLPANCRGKGWDGIGGFFWMIALASGASRGRGGVSGRGRSRSQARPRRHVRLIRSRRGSDPGHPSLPSPVENPNFAKRLRAGEGWSRSGPAPPVAPLPGGCHSQHRPDSLQQASRLVHRRHGRQAAAPGVQELQGVPADHGPVVEEVPLRAGLARIERHPTPAASPRLRLLLRYLFEETLGGIN